MKKLCMPLLFATALCGLSGKDAAAVTATTANVACSSTVKLQKSIDLVPAGTIATFVVSGTCTENIVVPEGKTIIIKGKSLAAKIVPLNLTLPALTSYGETTLQGMTLSNPTGAASALVLASHSALSIIASNLSAPKAEVVVAFWSASGGVIINTRITAGLGFGVDVSDSSNLYVQGSPTKPSGPDGPKVVVTGSKAGAFDCNNGSSLSLRTRASGGVNGAVLLTNNQEGVHAVQCAASLVNQTSAAGNLLISGVPAGGSAISINGGDVSLRNVAVQSNAGRGFSVQHGDVIIEGSTIKSNAQGDMWLDYGSVVRVKGGNGLTNIPDAFSTSKIECFQSGDVPSAKLLVDAAGVALPAGKTTSHLETSNPGCIAIN